MFVAFFVAALRAVAVRFVVAVAAVRMRVPVVMMVVVMRVWLHLVDGEIQPLLAVGLEVHG